MSRLSGSATRKVFLWEKVKDIIKADSQVKWKVEEFDDMKQAN